MPGSDSSRPPNSPVPDLPVASIQIGVHAGEQPQCTENDGQSCPSFTSNKPTNATSGISAGTNSPATPLGSHHTFATRRNRRSRAGGSPVMAHRNAPPAVWQTLTAGDLNVLRRVGRSQGRRRAIQSYVKSGSNPITTVDRGPPIRTMSPDVSPQLPTQLARWKLSVSRVLRPSLSCHGSEYRCSPTRVRPSIQRAFRDRPFGSVTTRGSRLVALLRAHSFLASLPSSSLA